MSLASFVGNFVQGGMQGADWMEGRERRKKQEARQKRRGLASRFNSARPRFVCTVTSGPWTRIASGISPRESRRSQTVSSTPGGYSLFGDDPPNLLLTAYGLQQMSDMDEVYDVDPQVISEMRTYVRDRQNADGSWPTDGRLEYPLGVTGTETSTTAYVTWSLAHSGADGRAVDDGVAYVRENLDVFDFSLTRAEHDRITRPSLLKTGVATVRGRLG